MKEEKKDYQYVFKFYEKKGDKDFDIESVIVNNVTKEGGLKIAEDKIFFIGCEDYPGYHYELDSICEYHVPRCVINGGEELDPIYSAVHQIAVNKFITSLDIVRRALQNEDMEVVEGELFDLERNLFFSRFVCLINEHEYYHYQSIVDDYWFQYREKNNVFKS